MPAAVWRNSLHCFQLVTALTQSLSYSSRIVNLSTRRPSCETCRHRTGETPFARHAHHPERYNIVPNHHWMTSGNSHSPSSSLSANVSFLSCMITVSFFKQSTSSTLAWASHWNTRIFSVYIHAYFHFNSSVNRDSWNLRDISDDCRSHCILPQTCRLSCCTNVYGDVKIETLPKTNKKLIEFAWKDRLIYWFLLGKKIKLILFVAWPVIFVSKFKTRFSVENRNSSVGSFVLNQACFSPARAWHVSALIVLTKNWYAVFGLLRNKKMEQKQFRSSQDDKHTLKTTLHAVDDKHTLETTLPAVAYSHGKQGKSRHWSYR